MARWQDVSGRPTPYGPHAGMALLLAALVRYLRAQPASRPN